MIEHAHMKSKPQSHYAVGVFVVKSVYGRLIGNVQDYLPVNKVVF